MKTKYLLLATLVFFVLAVPVIASSSTFLSQAQKYINANCSKKKIDNETALFCYLFNKSQEQDASIASLNTTLSPIPSEINNLKNHQTQTDQILASQAAAINNLQTGLGKTLKVFDANGQELGILVDSTFNESLVYNTGLGKLIRIFAFDGKQTIGAIPLGFYTTSDCTGIPYVQNTFDSNYLYSVFGKYMQIDTSVAPQTLTINSEGDTTCELVSTRQVTNLRPLQQTTNPFQQAVVMPVKVKYQ